MPDILTVRRFSLKDAVLIKDLLYDLGDTELASTFYGTYLENYTYDDGMVNWLPACADVDSIIINETLFKEHNIAILQTSRWDAVLSQMVERAKAYGLSEKFVETVFNAIHEESVREQNEILSK